MYADNLTLTTEAFALGSTMEEPGEQCTVVFALLVTEPASDCVNAGGEGNVGVALPPPPPPLTGPVTICAKSTVHM
jgi:hypothetical protein